MTTTELERLPASLRRRIRVTVDGCWEWTSFVEAAGYARVRRNGQRRMATHVVWEIVNGRPWPADAIGDHICHDPTICHKGNACRHRRCLNPAHVVPTTQAVNLSRERARCLDAEKTHCPAGHAYDYTVPATGKRQCRTCRNTNSRKYYARDHF